MEDKISVIIPIYNSAAYLDKCIQSILGQTYGNLEIILVNDGSNDDSEEVCIFYQHQDPRIIYLFQHNQGEGAARNAGLDAATGRYLVLCDSDDYLPPNAIETLYKYRDRAELIIGGIEKENKSKIQTFIPIPQIIHGRQIEGGLTEYSYYINPACGKLYDIKIIKDNHIRFNNFPYGADTFFVYSYLKYTDRICFIADIVYHVNVVGTSMSVRKVPGSWNYMRVLYEKGHELIHSDDNARHLLLMRGIKTALLLEGRISKATFFDTCEDMRLYILKEEPERIRYQESIYNHFVYILIRKGFYSMLYFLISFRIRYQIGL